MGFVNGTFMPLEQATVSVEDRGYQFGDGVYEVIRTYRGAPFQTDAHLSRLARSAQAIGLPMPYSNREWNELVTEGLKRAGFAESKVYIQLTRGVAPRDHAFPPESRPTVVMTIRELRPLAQAICDAGVEAITFDDIRWGRCDIKSVNLLANVLARQRAKEAGVFEAIFVRDGVVTEGSVSNVFVVRHGTLATAPEGPCILSGVTRALVLALARKEKLSVEERPVSLDELRHADEVFLCGTTVEVLPVVRIDGQVVGTGKPGPLTGRLSERFKQAVT
ncbi:MAG: D-amino-acid transaminase [Nitrospirae bacterium]|nr:MAG: D-amino-acid transaminase [Nitrospirota bacterium]